MGSVNPIVLDISSDDEPDPGGDDFNWLAEVLGAVDKKSNVPDEVVVVSEVKGNLTTENRKSKSSNPTVGNEDDDDDCVVLDGDPDKPALATAVDEDDNAAESDEVLVVGQKGQIACRDFPHPRHSCAKYPFSSTPHEKYCDMCHCYVCDTHAPCAYWCIGVSSIDHCHANDKEEIWKSQREYFRTGKTPSRPVSRPPPTTTLSMVPPHLACTPTQSLIRLAPNSMLQTQVGIRACSSSTGVAGIPNIRARCRIRQSRSLLHNHGLQQRPVHLLSVVRNNAVRKDRDPTLGNLRPRGVSSNRIPETPRVSGGGLVANLSGYGSLNNNNGNNNYSGNTAQGLQGSQSSPLVAPPNGWQDVPSAINLEVYTQQGNSQPNLTGYFSATPMSQSHMYTQHLGENLTASGGCQNQTNVDLFAQTEAPQPVADSNHQTFQQHGANSFPQSKLLSEFEDWLMDNPSVPVSPLPDPVSLNESEFTFDFDAFLDN